MEWAEHVARLTADEKMMQCCSLKNLVDIYQISPNTGPRCPEVSRKLSFPDYVTTAQDGGKVVSLTHRPVFNPRLSSWYSFLLEAESSPGPWCDRKDYVNETFQ